MAEEMLRRNLDRAFDPGSDFPSSSLLSRTMAGLAADLNPPRRQSGWNPGWILPAVAALIALAIVAALLVGGHALRPKAVQVKQPEINTPAGAPCADSGGDGRAPDTMTSATTGWSTGPLRTTDGGTVWHDVSPPAVWAGTQINGGQRTYPPSYVEYFLDSNHAWLARSYESATSCFAYVTVFGTTDGGRTWVKSAPVTGAVQPVHAPTHVALRLDFIDPQHGWLMVLGEDHGLLYSTSNGGVDWELVSQQLPAGFDGKCVVKFISLTTGYLGDCRDVEYPSPTLTFTNDGGKTWSVYQLPQPFGVTFIVDAPIFFDEKRAIIDVTATVGNGDAIDYLDYLAGTTDGGVTWHTLPALPPGFGVAYAFEDPRNFWILRSDGNGGPDTLYRTLDGGAKWTRVLNNLPPILWGTVVFVDAQQGFVIDTGIEIGQGSHDLVVTSDGGRTWKTIHPRFA